MAGRLLRGAVGLGRSLSKASLVPRQIPLMADFHRRVSPFPSTARSFHKVAAIYDVHLCTCGKSTAIARGPAPREEKLDEILRNFRSLNKSVTTSLKLISRHQSKDVIKAWVKDTAKKVFPPEVVDGFFPVFKYGALIIVVTSSVIVLKQENPEIPVSEYPSVLNTVRLFTLRKAIEFHKERLEKLSDEEVMRLILEVIRTLQKLSAMYFKNSELPKEASVKKVGRPEELDSLSEEELFLAISEAAIFLQEVSAMYINRKVDGTKLPSTTPGNEVKQNGEEVDSLTDEELILSITQVAATLQKVTATYVQKVGAAYINRKLKGPKLPPATPGTESKEPSENSNEEKKSQ